MSFPDSERKILLAVKGVGPAVLQRLEQLGYTSLQQLSTASARDIVARAAAMLGSSCWKNSPQAHAAMESAIAAAIRAQHPTPATSTDLLGLPNLGPRSQQMLQQAGIHSIAQLRQLGSVAAYVQTKQANRGVSINLLWALEGALTQLPWQEVARQHRTSLLLALDQHKNGR